MSDEALRRRLKRLGRRRSETRKSRVVTSDRVGLPPGDDIETPHGSVLRIEAQYPLSYHHAGSELSRIFDFGSGLAAEVTNQPELVDIPFEDMVFLDTETTGLAGGAGTIAFLVGVGKFVGDQFRLRQYFLRDPGEEAGLLYALQEDLEVAGAFVSFNGRVFDVPLLEMRYMMGLRKYWSLSSMPQLDLLHPARRLWKHNLPSCSLGTIEQMLMGVQRSDDDVPGALIPGMYLDYLRTGDASEMRRVLYHNAIDILSLVSLAVYVLERHHQDDPSLLLDSEALAVARWHQAAGREESAAAAFRAALDGDDRAIRVEAYHRYTGLLKRVGRRDQALALWAAWHDLAPDDPRPCIELAKHHEWHSHDLSTAQQWAQEALLCLTHWPQDWRREEMWSDIEHRLTRLARKLESR